MAFAVLYVVLEKSHFVSDEKWHAVGMLGEELRHELDIQRGGLRMVAAAIDVFDGEVAFDEALAQVSGHRRAKALAYRFEPDRQLSVLAGLLLDELLADYGLRERDMTYREGEQGKPTFADRADLHFSLAHSKQMAVAALAGVPVGVDVEYLPGFPRDIAEPYEWTEMESVGKLLGCGVGSFVDGATFHIPDGVTVAHTVLDDYLVCIAVQS